MELVRLDMVRGKRSVFIGLFPSEDRAENVAFNLEWGGWRSRKRGMKMETKCEQCEHKKGMGNKKHGVKIPGGHGKCTRPAGLCLGEMVNDGEMALCEIFPNPEQPRKNFPIRELEELAANIKNNGLLEPIVVVKRRNFHMIIAGERRWRACKMAGLERVPVRVMEADEKKIAELALLENVCRQDLNVIEEAKGFKGLIDFGMTAEEVAEKMGFKQPWRVQERLNLLKLDTLYQDCVVKNILTPSQAQEMSRLSTEGQRVLFGMIRDGKASSYNKLRSLASAILYKEEQSSFLPEPDPRETEVKNKYDRMIENVLGLVSKSFSAEDLDVLQSALDSNLSVNIEKIDMIIGYLSKIKRSLLQAESTREVIKPSVTLQAAGNC